MKMSGKKCPHCGKLTYFDTNVGGKCNACGYQGITPPLGGVGGKGQRCLHCGKFQVFHGKCRNCGTIYKIPDEK